MFVRLIARFVLAPLGLVCGVLAGFALLAFVHAEHLGAMRLVPEDIMLLGYDLSLDAVAVMLLLAPLMGAPAIVAVLIAEMFSIRSWIYHASAGAGVALMPWSLAPTSFDEQTFSTSQVLAAGFVGGLAHWLIAGRTSGLAAPAAPSRPTGAPPRR